MRTSAAALPVSVNKTTLLQRKYLWEEKLSQHRIGGWRAVSAAELPGKDSPERRALLKDTGYRAPRASKCPRCPAASLRVPLVTSLRLTLRLASSMVSSRSKNLDFRVFGSSRVLIFDGCDSCPKGIPMIVSSQRFLVSGRTLSLRIDRTLPRRAYPDLPAGAWP